MLLTGFDPTQDSPIEILHTILLGVVKYVWHFSHTGWTDEQQRLYAVRLQAASIDGLDMPPFRPGYIMQYAGSLIGRQLKAVGQINAFLTHDICEPRVFALWRAVSELMALLWIPEVDNLEQYLASQPCQTFLFNQTNILQDDVDVAASNVIDMFACVDSTKVLAKVKLHLLTHLRTDICRFGPLVGCSTEVFESFNAVFRQCSILSNHQAPSRDIALQFGKQEGFKHRVTSGWWKAGDEKWVQVGPGIKRLVSNNLEILEAVGLSSKIVDEPGTLHVIFVFWAFDDRTPAHIQVWSSWFPAKVRRESVKNAATYLGDQQWPQKRSTPPPSLTCKNGRCSLFGTWLQDRQTAVK